MKNIEIDSSQKGKFESNNKSILQKTKWMM